MWWWAVFTFILFNSHFPGETESAVSSQTSGLVEWCFYVPDVLPVTQPSVTKQNAKH